MSSEDSLIWTSSAITHTGKVRKFNEDAYLERCDIGLWAIADGMGGHEAGDLASQTIVDALAQVERNDILSVFVDAVEDKLIGANKKLQELAHQYHNDRTIGSTIVILLAHQQHCIVMWAGDSRAYLFRQGNIQQLSRDHSEVEELVRRGLIPREQAEHHPAGNVITRAVGASPEVYIDIDAEGVQSGDTFLLCSDGLYKHIADQELKEFLEMDNLDEICNGLLSLTLERGATDNVTVIVIRALNAEA